jgi:1-phosphofructokinase
MIVTLTPNPSVDRTVHIDALPRGEVIRARQSRSEPSGKGVNVALALRAHRHPVLAVLPVGGPVGAQLAGMLRAYGVAHRTVPVAGDIRSNVSLVEPDGTVTKINEPGPVLDGDEVAALIGAALTDADGVTWLAACGSLPPGAPADLYARLVAPARRRGVRVAVDSSGPALAAAVAAGPDLVKPNAHELAEVTGRPLRTLGDVVDAAAQVRGRGAGAVLASLGADGAVLLDDGGPRHGEAPVATVVSAVGAGDALRAGFLSAGGRGPEALRAAVSWGAAAVQHEGTLLAAGGWSGEVTVTGEVDRSRQLREPVGA